MSESYSKKLNLYPQSCDCQYCQRMCRSPCNGSVEDMEKLIDAGYAKRLMFDDLPSQEMNGAIIKPALKGYEGKQSPWETSSERGCTFWKKGKCELHDSGLKPWQGKIAIHDNTTNYYGEFAKLLDEDYASERGKALIECWKKEVNYQDEE